MEMNEITDAFEINSSTKGHEQGSKTSVSESSAVNSIYLPGTITFSHLAVKK
jgi:hypothetical protein